MQLNAALESNNAEMTKRLKYTKDILTHMLSNNNVKPGSSQNVQSAHVKKTDMMSTNGFGSEIGGSTVQSAATGNRRPLNVIN